MNRSEQQDIRGVCLKDTDLLDRSFQKARAGKTKIRNILDIGVWTIFSSLSSITSMLSSGSLAGVIYYDFNENPIQIPLICLSLILYFLNLFILSFSDYLDKKIITFNLGLILTSLIMASVFERRPGVWALVLFLGLSIVFAWIGALTTALALTVVWICSGLTGRFLAILGASLTATALTLGSIKIALEPKPFEAYVTLIPTLAIIITASIITYRAVRGRVELNWIRDIAIFWAAIGGTSFYGSNLTDVCFEGADLRHTDLRKTNLTRTNFKDVTGLELSRLQGTILEQPNVRKLLTSRDGYGKDFTEADLSGADLKGVDLREAILVKTQLLDADLSGACLTDACIQDWNINHNTRFRNVDCKRVYLKRSPNGHFLEPKPDSGEFGPGEFEKWITDVRDTIDLIFQNGLNWRAFAFSLTQTAINNEGIDLSVRSIENKGDGVVVAKVGVSLDTNKTSIHQEITGHYNEAVAAIEAKYELVLKAKDDEIERLVAFHETQQKFIQGLVAGIAEPKEKVLIQGEGNRVYVMNRTGDVMENSNQNINAGGNVDLSSRAKVSVGGDLTATGSSITLGDLNGQVTNTIQQLQDISTSNGKELGQILSTLQEAINSDAALSDTQKEQALEAVATLAEEGKKSPESRMNKLCSMAVNALKGVASTVTDASKLAEILKTSLPTLTKLLGL